MKKIVYGVEIIEKNNKYIYKYTDNAKSIKTLKEWENRFPYNQIKYCFGTIVIPKIYYILRISTDKVIFKISNIKVDDTYNLFNGASIYAHKEKDKKALYTKESDLSTVYNNKKINSCILILKLLNILLHPSIYSLLYNNIEGDFYERTYYNYQIRCRFDK